MTRCDLLPGRPYDPILFWWWSAVTEWFIWGSNWLSRPVFPWGLFPLEQGTILPGI
jgi:hypothetical protein